jgi:ATP phosphoribosyltransferase
MQNDFFSSMEPILRITIQKSGRLSDQSLSLLVRAGLDIPSNGRALRSRCRNFPLEILYLRAKDSLEVIQDGLADIGILGQNTLAESGFKGIEEATPLGFGYCRLCLAAPKRSEIATVSDLSGKKIATSHPRLLRKYLDQSNISAEIIPMNGSVEIAPSLNLADAICDLVSSGNTLLANQLEEIETIFSSGAVLVSKSKMEPKKQKILSDLLLRIDSVLNAKNMKSVVMNAPKSALLDIESVLPGLESPTIMPLKKEGWFAVHSVVCEDEHFWENISKLKQAGAKGILVSPIERIIF